MKKYLIPILIILTFSVGINAQSPHLEWNRELTANSFSQSLECIIADPQGNVYTVLQNQGDIDMDPGTDTFFIHQSPIFTDNHLMFSKLDSMGQFVWGKQLGGSWEPDITIDNSGNFYITGGFIETADFDPDTSNYILNALVTGGLNYEDIFVLKLDPNGNFLWVKQIGNTSQDRGRTVRTDANGNVYVYGEFNGLVDFDPGAGVETISSGATGGLFLLKLTSSGNFGWVKTLSSTAWINPGRMETDTSGNFFMIGKFGGTVDFDPDTTVNVKTSLGNSDIFVLKFNATGTFDWVATFGGALADEGIGISVDHLGNVLTTGVFRGTCDFEPGPGTVNLSALGDGDIFISKLSPQGTYIWAKRVGGNGGAGSSLAYDVGSSIKADRQGNVLYGGRFVGTVDFDPGSGVSEVIALGSADGFISKLDAGGNFLWVSHTGGNSQSTPLSDRCSSVFIDNSGILYAAGVLATGTWGVYSGNDSMLVSGNQPGYFIQKWNDAGNQQVLCSGFGVVADSVIDISCSGSGTIYMHAIYGTPPYQYSWLPFAGNQQQISVTSAGVYTLSVSDSNGCVASSTVLVNAPVSIANFDAGINAHANSYIRGANTWISLDAYNNGCTPISGILQFIDYGQLQFISAVPPPDFISGNTLTWNFTDLTYDSAHLMPLLRMKVDSTALAGTEICFTASVNLLAGDVDSSNNSVSYCSNVVSSYDPNDISVSPAGKCVPAYVDANERLTYTIRFQNTGTYLAENIYLIDSLPSALNLNSIRVTGQSHEQILTEIFPGNVLKFRFDDILLPDSATNETASHGYVSFDVLPVNGVDDGTEISNKAGIYFDFNDPVYTNTVSNTLIAEIPVVNTDVVQSNLTLTATASGVSYQWIDCNNQNQPIEGETSQTFQAPLNGNFAVVISDGICEGTSICYSTTLLGLNSSPSNILSIYPNPSERGSLVVEAHGLNGPFQIEVLTVTGQTILNKASNGIEKTSLELPDVAGIYFIKVVKENRVISVSRVIRN